MSAKQLLLFSIQNNLMLSNFPLHKIMFNFKCNASFCVVCNIVPRHTGLASSQRYPERAMGKRWTPWDREENVGGRREKLKNAEVHRTAAIIALEVLKINAKVRRPVRTPWDRYKVPIVVRATRRELERCSKDAMQTRYDRQRNTGLNLQAVRFGPFPLEPLFWWKNFFW